MNRLRDPATGRFVAAESANGKPADARLAILSEIVDRLNFARLHGLQYDDDRDLYVLGGYPRQLTFQHFAGFYLRDPIAGALIDMPAETTWRLPPDIVEEDRPDGTEFTRAWDALAKRLNVWKRFEAVDKLAGIGHYAVLLIGARGGDDRELARPLRRLNGPEDVLYLSPYAEVHARPETWVTNPGDPRYGQVDTYKIDLAGDVQSFRQATAGAGTLLVHSSRVLHIAEGRLGDEVYGRPALERVYNDLMDYAKISTSTAEAYWQRVAGILYAKLGVAEGSHEIEWSDDDLATLDETLKELYHDLRRTAYIQGGELKRLAESEPDPGPAAKLYQQRIAAGRNIPARMLFGSETGERASTEDQKSWLGSIAERQTTHGEPVFIRQLVDRLIEFGALPRPETGDYLVQWPTLFRESEKEQAEANRARAQAAQALTPIGGSPLELIEVDDEGNVWLVPRSPDEPAPVLPPEPMPAGMEPGAPQEATPQKVAR